MKTVAIVFAGAVSLMVAGCSSGKSTTASGTLPSLKKAYEADFLIGTAINTQQVRETDPVSAALIKQQFNAITPENNMKAEIIHPEWDKYNFQLADELVEYGAKNNMKVNGHALVWHSQLSRFANRMQNVDSFRTFFRDHITTVAKRYHGKLHSWDVVNEALNEDGTLRNSVFLQRLGPDYLVEAFRLAAEATPGTELYYNDYNNEQPAKRAGCIELIKKIQASGVRIDGVGIQGHWHLGKIPLKDIEESIIQYTALGLKVMITELDIEVLPRNFSGADVNQQNNGGVRDNLYPNGLPDSVQQKLASDYESLFALFLKHKDKITRVTFWGVDDGHTWLNNWPVRGRTNHPLLFDRQFKPKPAFHKLIALKQNVNRK